jgi:hypothetical protein
VKNTLLLWLISILLWPFAAGAAPASSALPLDHWSYPVLERLAALGLIDSALQGSRPFTRLEAARQTREATGKAEAAVVDAVSRAQVARLGAEFRDELAQLAASGPSRSTFKPLRSLGLAYAYRDGADSAIFGTNARQFALTSNNAGIAYGQGPSGQLLAAGEANLGGWLALDARVFALAGEEDSDLRLLHGRAALGLGPFEVSLGRQSLWWGQGRRGSLILTDNAQALDMLRITNPVPARLPWLFKYLGPFRFDVFWSELESARVVPEPYLAGLRLNFKPFSWLEIGGSRTVMFGGEGRPEVDLDEFITILAGKNLSGGEDTSNQLAALDVRLTLPFLQHAEIYGELGGEDEANSFIAKKALLVGLYLPRIEPSSRLALRVEHANLNYEGYGAVWYRHSQYQSGYTYQGRILGHPMGGDARSWYGELAAYLPYGLTGTLELDYQKRGFSRPEAEIHLQPAVGVSMQVAENLRLNGRYAFDRVRNSDFVPGRDDTRHFTFLGLEFSP